MSVGILKAFSCLEERLNSYLNRFETRSSSKNPRKNESFSKFDLDLYALISSLRYSTCVISLKKALDSLIV